MACEEWPDPVYPCDQALVNDGIEAAALEWATGILSSAAGGRYGICEHVESVWGDVGCTCGLATLGPYGGVTRAIHGSRCRCCRLALSHYPVVEVQSVTLNGVTWEPFSAGDDDWLFGVGLRLDGARELVRTDGTCWPWASDDCVDAPIVVRYRAGVPPPPGTAVALGELACEAQRALQPSLGECRLPSRALSVTRQGVTVELADPGAFLTEGLTGLPIVDSWIRSVNPSGLRQPSSVYDALRSGTRVTS